MLRCSVLLSWACFAGACTAEAPPKPAEQPEARDGSAKPAASEPTRSPESSPEEPGQPEVCASAGIGLDLRALPHPVEPEDATSFTRGQAQGFRELAPPSVRVEIFSTPGFAAFDARLRGAKDVDVLAHCTRMTADFMPTVPGHPSSRKPGGSVSRACALVPCDAAI